LHIFFEKLAASGGLRPQTPWVCPHMHNASAATANFQPTRQWSNKTNVICIHCVSKMSLL